MAEKNNTEVAGIFPPAPAPAPTPAPALAPALAPAPTPAPALAPVSLDSIIDLFLARPPGLSWPWREIANLTEIDIGSITTVIAGTSHGKTAIALNLALHFLEQGKKVLFWSGELPPEILVVKLLGLLSNSTLTALKRELVNHKNGDPVAAEISAALPISENYCNRLYIPPAWDLPTCQQLLALADTMRPDTIIIDYIQQLRPAATKFRTRDEEIEFVMDDLNLYAIRQQLPIIIFAQINREAKNTEKPNLTCIRHSATIEQYSANVIGIWNASMARYPASIMPRIPAGGWYWYDDQDATAQAVAQAESENKTLLELIILKSRYHGHVGKAVPLYFSGPTGQITDFPAATPVAAVVLRR